ncbi:hypothetical protein [Demequina lutea]|uniref:DUF5667 domain-containing protein n=1 Tax=Demequina lutea TaxID=431489 RepID=A0A7Y9Z8R6_9MICO|nr:hypothetical protein [Demequina lutea]NYI40914.1 hypothetical protein [Demequina lutea]
MENNPPFAERDADAAVSGRVPVDPELVAVQRALSHMKEALIMEPNTEVISAHAAQFAAAVPPPTSAPHVRRGSPWRRRAVAAVAVAAVSVFGVAGAAAANQAAPGDALYGVDKALESVGILNGGTSERLQESKVLASRGDVAGAVALSTKALNADGQHAAAVALERAVIAAKSQSSGNDVRAQVSSMLAWMSQQTRGADFGAQVSQHAKEIAANAKANGTANAKANGKANAKANGSANSSANANANVDANPTAAPGSDANPTAALGSDANPTAALGSDANPAAAPGSEANPAAAPGSEANPAAAPGSEANPTASAHGRKP